MVRLLFSSLITLVLFTMNSFAQELPDYVTEKSTSFTLQVHGFDKVEGEIRIAMFDSKEEYTKEPVFAVVLPVEGKEVEWKVPDLPFGEYAIAVYHDKNKNGKLDTNFLGIPKEDYGFSNNARGKFGPASWEDAKFSISEQSFTHLIIIE
ncbi:MAG: DUF2141 domain-containing protein [Balneolaceae bacterium]|nr:DUF2141 domain-containing protein [Balneolaceae bacterium]MBO6547737.1 DUF2141 domain-containing protein [Balneolaceae bacterium]MBO6648248.1 DUF2141 domain-containing protein [Balneolaceae bacterium]